ncbi:MAG: 4-hydroxy-tetrahydrodipicolinate reductase [Flavobacteriaceae bacterium]|nr:4-hydroxy-tetrahydrodipicolinate reductase [Flavobacteriaceae bacterium]
MKIALLGYGKMGKEIEKIALERGHAIVSKLDFDTENFQFNKADVAIDFSAPNVAFGNVSLALTSNVPVVSGTTGWLDKYDEAVAMCHKNKGAMLYASNFSLGVNLFFDLNIKLAKLMRQHSSYNVAIEETHHTQKKDAPSGTAISLAEQIIENSTKEKWLLEASSDKETINIKSNRLPDVPGTHWVNYTSEVDKISIKHEAYSRKGFALGAVLAAEWIAGREGVFSMKDVLNIG